MDVHLWETMGPGHLRCTSFSSLDLLLPPPPPPPPHTHARCRPALIQLHHYAWWHAVGDGVEDGGLFYHPAAEAQLGVFAQVGLGG